MHNTLAQAYKLLQLKVPVAVAATVVAATNTSIDVEQYDDDAMALVTVGACSGTDASGVIVIKGSLVATPTVYDQTLATFAAITATSDGFVAGAQLNLAGIARIAPQITVADTTTPSLLIGIVVLARTSDQGAGVNSTTPAA
jgi:hypothetical protein